MDTSSVGPPASGKPLVVGYDVASPSVSLRDGAVALFRATASVLTRYGKALTLCPQKTGRAKVKGTEAAEKRLVVFKYQFGDCDSKKKIPHAHLIACG